MSACAPTTEAAPGVVSTSLCGDAYLLASGREVAALSWQSDGPLSTVEGGYPTASADPETLVALSPETLLLGPGETVDGSLLPGTDIVRLDWAEDWAGVRDNAGKLGGGLANLAITEPTAD